MASLNYRILSLCIGLPLASALVPQIFFFGDDSTSLTSPPPEFDWDTISTSDNINWNKCYDKFHCARLTLPLDWNNISNPNNVSIGIIRLPASVSLSDPSHGGTIFTNPGGPGGPGTLWALANAEKLQRQLDGPDKHYEILSFDPRGIFSSKPNAYCFANALESEIWYDQKEAVGGLETGDYALKFNWAAEKARGELCATTGNGRYENGDNLREHVSTAYVARDMLEILNRIDEEKLVAVTSLQKGEDCQKVLQEEVPRSARKAKLQYFGTSYGTFLGETFAAMYPEHVGRMVLDANIDADNWVSRYEAGIDDHQKIRDYFFERCFIGKEECDFYRKTDSSPADLKKRFDKLMKDLGDFPNYATGHGRAMPITPTEIQGGFLTTSYQPLFFFKPFAKFLNDLFSDSNPGIPFWERPVPTKETFSDRLLQQKYQGGEVGPAVHCSDGPPLSDEPLSEFQAYVGNLTARFGSAAAGLQADYKLSCWTWPKGLRTKWRFDGPFEANDTEILFVNNRLDPATSANNARKMADRFKGSVMLEQDAAGHGALWPAGDCIWKHVRDYVHNGIMPPKGIVCQPPCIPFGKEACKGVDTSVLPLRMI